MRFDCDLGLGIGWRPEIALFIDRRRDLGFIEVMAESIAPGRYLPQAVENLRARGVQVVPHGVSLSLGGAEPLDPKRVAAFAGAAERVAAPLASEHIAFVRAGDVEAGHLLPLPRTWDALTVLVENVRQVQAELSVPLALENIASLFQWPDAQLSEAEFLSEVLERTDALLLLDAANLHSDARNHGLEVESFLDRIPLERLAYSHVAGGLEEGELYHDTHAHPTGPAVLDVLTSIASRARIPGVLLERDEAFPSDEEMGAELDAIAAAWARGRPVEV